MHRWQKYWVVKGVLSVVAPNLDASWKTCWIWLQNTICGECAGFSTVAVTDVIRHLDLHFTFLSLTKQSAIRGTMRQAADREMLFDAQSVPRTIHPDPEVLSKPYS